MIAIVIATTRIMIMDSVFLSGKVFGEQRKSNSNPAFHFRDYNSLFDGSCNEEPA